MCINCLYQIFLFILMNTNVILSSSRKEYQVKRIRTEIMSDVQQALQCVYTVYTHYTKITLTKNSALLLHLQVY